MGDEPQRSDASRVAWIESTPPIAVVWRGEALELHGARGQQTIDHAALDGHAPREVFSGDGWLGIATARAIWGLELSAYDVMKPRRLAERTVRDLNAARTLWERLADVDLEDAEAVEELLDPALGVDRALLDSGLYDLEEDTLESELENIKGWFADPNAPWFIEHHGGALFEVWRLGQAAARSHLIWIEDVTVSLESYARGVLRAFEPALYLFFEDPCHGRYNQTDVYRVPLDAPRARAAPRRPSRIGGFTMSPRGPFVALEQSDEPTYAHAPELHDLRCEQVAPAGDAGRWADALRVRSSQIEAQREWDADELYTDRFPSTGGSTLIQTLSFSDRGDTLLVTYRVSGARQTLLIDLRTGDIAHMLIQPGDQDEDRRDLRSGAVETPLSDGVIVRDRRGRRWLPFPSTAVAATGDGDHWLITTPEGSTLWTTLRGGPAASWTGADERAPLRSPALASLSPDTTALLTLDDDRAAVYTPLPAQPANDGAPTRSASALILWCLSRRSSTASEHKRLSAWLAIHFESEYLAALVMWEGLARSARRELGQRPPPAESARPITEDTRTRARELISTVKPARGRRLDVELIAACLSLCDAYANPSERDDVVDSLRYNL